LAVAISHIAASHRSITQFSVTSSIVSSSRTCSSCIDASSHHSTTSGSRQLKPLSIASQHPHPHPRIHHEPPRICKHCHIGFYPSSSCHHLNKLISICHAQQTNRHTKFMATQMCSQRSDLNLTLPFSLSTASLISPVPMPLKGQRP
jgi:hypothetical protein